MARPFCPARGVAGSAVIAEQVKCIDWRGRRARLKEHLPAQVLERVTGVICRLILPKDQAAV
jgi:hypothetical protein